MNDLYFLDPNGVLFLQFRSVPTTVPNNDNGMAFPAFIVAQFRRVGVRTRHRKPTASCIDILCVRASAEPRDFLIAQELLLRGTSAYRRMGRRDDPYERRKLLLKVIFITFYKQINSTIKA